jgi:uncharacterized surface protein with fasciclin (FAS1) repeats
MYKSLTDFVAPVILHPSNQQRLRKTAQANEKNGADSMKINTISLTKTAFASLLLSVSASIATADTFETQGNDVLSVAKQKGSFNTLAKAIEIAGLQDALTAQGPVTIFAPTDEAFAKLPAGELEALLKPENKDKLVKLLTHHVVPGKALETEDMKRSRGATTVGGDDVKFELVRGRLRVDGARVTGDYNASNGTVVAVDSVLLPN